MSSAPCIVVMGVSGCGKTTVARALARALGLDFIEGDELHSARNVALMAAGTPLTDADRHDWLLAIAACLRVAGDAGRGVVVSCSGLKRSYRDVLRSGAPGLRLVHLHGECALLEQRMRARAGHYMPASLLQSQLDTLEPPQADEAALTLDISADAEALVAAALQGLRQGALHADNPADNPMSRFIKVHLYTDTDGRARFRDEPIALSEGKPQAMLSPLMPSGGLQLRMSPVGFRSAFHCTETPQWLFVLSGQMEIGLQDGSTRVFKPGEHFYSDDRLPPGATFDPGLHGHWSRQLGPEPLVTAFVRG